MASIGEYEEQQQKAIAARQKWVHQPGTPEWEKLISNLASQCVIAIVRHGLGGPSKMIVNCAEDYMKAKTAYEVAKFIASTALKMGDKQMEELADMEAELEAVVADSIAKCKREVEQGRKEMGL